MEENTTSLAPGGLTGRLRAQKDGTVPVRVVGGVRLVVDGLWAELWRPLCDNVNNLVERHEKNNNQSNNNGSKQKARAIPLRI